jgi:endonuclease/exonuclease/phosphatase (EEP) superfamily protein YafD
VFILSLTFILIALGLLFVSLTSIVHTGFYAVELFSHFQFQALFVGIIFLLVAASIPIKNKTIILALTATAIGINFFNIGDYVFPYTKKSALRSQHSVLQANVFKFNFKTGPLLDLIKKEDPDIISLSEVTSHWEKALEPIKDNYPHHIIVPEEGSHGMALYSKLPFKSSRVEQISDLDMPSFIVEFKNFVFISIHPLPPVYQSFYENRNQHFEWLENYINNDIDTNMPIIVSGDMNTTMFAPRFKTFVKKTGLKNARIGRGIQNSWYAFDLGFLGIPIDHFLHNARILIQSSRIMPDIQSDHLPILTRFAIKERKENKTNER